ncbi:MAG: zinc-dependent metalloprotease [Deltaproteobacteria bacterium]|nr:zinc-dependent metalloprotease [Deltaproteobacteria bacterium]
MTIRKLSLGLVLLASCVDHRPIRNGLRDESIYLEKSQLTQPNPKLGAATSDDTWLYKVTVVKASSPNSVADYLFPGIEGKYAGGDPELVRFRFGENTLQVVDATKLMRDDADDPNDDLSTSAERVIMEFPGSHVDVKLRESLDGERTNFLEENTEEPWQQRQKFRVDFEGLSTTPIGQVAWYYADFLGQCADVTGSSLVPGSYEFDEKDQSLSFLVEINYLLRVESAYGPCYDVMTLISGAGASTIQFRFSFYRPGVSTYVPLVIGEKDEVNKKYGVFQALNLFRDDTTGILSARSVARRWDPNRTQPVVYYFAEGFPEKWKPSFRQMVEETNRVLLASGAKLRLEAKDFDFDGKRRNLGDLRYSFFVFHRDIDTTRGLLGYGPSSADPRTGELLSATVNLYEVGLDRYRYLIQDFLEEFGGKTREEGKKWEEITCTPGETVAPADEASRLKSTLVQEMRRVMELPEVTEESIAREDMIPTPARPKEEFLANYHRLLPEIRYAEPYYNPYVYRPSPVDLPARMRADKEFTRTLARISSGENPFGTRPLDSQAGVLAQDEFAKSLRSWKRNHHELVSEMRRVMASKTIMEVDLGDALSAIAGGARQCTPGGHFESDDQYRERILDIVLYRTAIHELGHTLGLRHNFYASADAKHMREAEVSASVMDYVSPIEEAGAPRAWGAYDEAALTWIYGGEAKKAEVMADDYLYCTDEHADRSPLCQRFDLGVTPSEIVLNNIERYDWLYKIRNRRAYRTFWDTTGYAWDVYDWVFSIQRFWYLGIFTWGGGEIQNTLKRLDQVDPTRTVLTDPEYDEIAQDMYNDVANAIGMTMAFYDAVINQPASFRNYQDEYDPFYGDLLRLGIITDKLFTMFAFMDLSEVYNYDPNIYTYVSMYDAPFGSRNYGISQRVLDNMLGANYDTFPWFKYYALFLFANATNSNLIGTIELKERIAIQRFETNEELELAYGAGILDRVSNVNNPQRIFTHNGEEYVYGYLPDQLWHLVASKSRSPVSYQFIKEYNESLASASRDEDTYGLKILLAYYEYFNNFVGF